MKNKTLKHYMAALLAMFFWSFSFVWFKVAYQAYEPMTVVLIRLSLSAVIMFVVARLLGKLQTLRKGDLSWMILLSFFEPFLLLHLLQHLINNCKPALPEGWVSKVDIERFQQVVRRLAAALGKRVHRFVGES